MQGRHCNFCNTQRINGSRTPLFAHDKAKCAIESAIASFFAPHPAPFSPVLSLSEILLNHVSLVTHAAALILASDSFGRPSASFVLPYPAAVRPFAAFVLASGSSGRASAGTLGVLDKGGEGSDGSWVAEDKGRRGPAEVPIPPYFCSIIFKQ